MSRRRPSSRTCTTGRLASRPAGRCRTGSPRNHSWRWLAESAAEARSRPRSASTSISFSSPLACPPLPMPGRPATGCCRRTTQRPGLLFGPDAGSGEASPRPLCAPAHGRHSQAVRHIAGPIVALCFLTAGCSALGNVPGASGPGTSAPAPPSTSPPASVPSMTSAGSEPPVPILGLSRGATEGYGSARPSTISNGGDPTGVVMNVSWQSWGGPQAVGTGTGYYDPPNVPVDQSTSEQATIVAFDLGTCDGRYMYQAIEWYFPESGGSFTASNYLNTRLWTQ